MNSFEQDRSPSNGTKSSSDRPRRKGWPSAVRLVRRRGLIAAVAALPLFQGLACLPDPIGALNFELQSFVNSVFIETISVIVENVLRLP